MGCKGVFLRRYGSNGEGEAESVDGLSSEGVSGRPLLLLEIVSWIALRNVNMHAVDLSRVISSMEWVGRKRAYGVRERVTLWKWLYIDVDARALSPIVACTAEQEEVR